VLQLLTLVAFIAHPRGAAARLGHTGLGLYGPSGTTDEADARAARRRTRGKGT